MNLCDNRHFHFIMSIRYAQCMKSVSYRKTFIARVIRGQIVYFSDHPHPKKFSIGPCWSWLRCTRHVRNYRDSEGRFSLFRLFVRCYWNLRPPPSSVCRVCIEEYTRRNEIPKIVMIDRFIFIYCDHLLHMYKNSVHSHSDGDAHFNDTVCSNSAQFCFPPFVSLSKPVLDGLEDSFSHISTGVKGTFVRGLESWRHA